MPTNIDPFLCNIIIYAFAEIETDHLKPFEWNDLSEPWMKGLYEQTVGLKKQNPNLKVLLAVGGLVQNNLRLHFVSSFYLLGWNHGPGRFSDLVVNEAIRKRFVESSAEFLIKNGFDGLDVE